MQEEPKQEETKTGVTGPGGGGQQEQAETSSSDAYYKCDIYNINCFNIYGYGYVGADSSTCNWQGKLYWYEDVFQIISRGVDYCNNIGDLRLKNLNHKNESPTIPYTLHYVYLTDPDSPKDLNSRYYEIMKDTINNLKSGIHSSNWDVKLWSNIDQFSFSSETQELFETLGIQVHDVTQLKEYSRFRGFLESGKHYVTKADVIRALVIKERGGMYFDLDYHLEKNIDDLVDAFDEIYSTETGVQSKVTNAVFGSKTDGTLTNAIIDEIYYNIFDQDDPNRPEYIDKPVNTVAETMVKTGPIAYTKAVYKKIADCSDNCDNYIVLSHGILSNIQKIEGLKGQKNSGDIQGINACSSDTHQPDCIEFGDRGFDEFGGTWATKELLTTNCHLIENEQGYSA